MYLYSFHQHSSINHQNLITTIQWLLMKTFHFSLTTPLIAIICAAPSCANISSTTGPLNNISKPLENPKEFVCLAKLLLIANKRICSHLFIHSSRVHVNVSFQVHWATELRLVLLGVTNVPTFRSYPHFCKDCVTRVRAREREKRTRLRCAVYAIRAVEWLIINISIIKVICLCGKNVKASFESIFSYLYKRDFNDNDKNQSGVNVPRRENSRPVIIKHIKADDKRPMLHDVYHIYCVYVTKTNVGATAVSDFGKARPEIFKS